MEAFLKERGFWISFKKSDTDVMQSKFIHSLSTSFKGFRNSENIHTLSFCAAISFANIKRRE